MTLAYIFETAIIFWIINYYVSYKFIDFMRFLKIKFLVANWPYLTLQSIQLLFLQMYKAGNTTFNKTQLYSVYTLTQLALLPTTIFIKQFYSNYCHAHIRDIV